MKIYYPVFKATEISIKDLFRKIFPKKRREKICNFCYFAKEHWMPDGVECTEEHHQEGKDRWQCYSHTCKYFKDCKKRNIYNLK